MSKNTYVLRIEVDGVGSGSSSDKKESGGTVSAENSDNGVTKLAKKVAKVYSATQLVRQIAGNAIGEMSAYSGNAREQAKVETGLGLAEKVLTTGIAFAINPVAGALSLLGNITDLAYEVRANNFNRELERMQIAQMQQRANIYNRSR